MDINIDFKKLLFGLTLLLVFGEGVAAELIANDKEVSWNSNDILASGAVKVIMGITLGIVVSWVFQWLKKRKKDRNPKKAIFNEVRSNLEQIQREQTKKKIDNITQFIAALDKEALKKNLELTEKLMNAGPESMSGAEKENY